MIVWKHRLPGEFDYEALWGSVAAAVLLVARFFPFGRFPIGIPCWFRALSGLPCPSCGSTRAFAALARGRIADGFALNPAAAVLFFGLLAFLPYVLWVCLLRKPRLRVALQNPREAILLILCATTLILANWAYLILAAE